MTDPPDPGSLRLRTRRVTWRPNAGFDCRYVARQIAIKTKYELWVTQPERMAMSTFWAVVSDARHWAAAETPNYGREDPWNIPSSSPP
jgi:hypothetical protein